MTMPGLASRFRAACLLVVIWLSSHCAAAADLPALSNSSTLSGAATSAQFFAGARANGGAGYVNSFMSQDSLELIAEVRVESAHINRSGSLYLVAALNGHYFMRRTDGNFYPWDLQVASLLPATAEKLLQASETLTVLQDTSVGSLGIAGNTLSIYLAYKLANSNELYFSGSPLTLNFENYNPLQLHPAALQTLDTMLIDSKRNREVPLLVFFPESRSPRPLILFSHGLGGSRFTAEYLGQHWSARGYVVAFLQHRGSDETILEGVPPSQILTVMSQAASASNHTARMEDVTFVIDQLEILNNNSQSSFFGRLDMKKIAMSGHSFGARTTQAVSGEDVEWLNYETREPRIKLAIPLSPSSPNLANSASIFGNVDIPWLLMTGTNDVSAIVNTTVEDRLAVYPALPPGGKYELVLFEGEHHAFTDHPISVLQVPRNPAHHSIIMALSTAFLDAWLMSYPDARNWLDGTGARSVLLPKDSFKFK